jgi:hypothetical protein
MVKGPGISNRLISPHPLSLFLASLFAFSLQLSYGALIAVLLALPYYMFINYIIKAKKISLHESREILDPFLLAFSNNLKALCPEEAFLKAYELAPSGILLDVLDRIRNGNPLPRALKSVGPSSQADRVLLRLLADLVSFSKDEASRRISLYVGYRQEKRKWKSELAVRMSVLFLRFRVLGLISSASLAVIAFASPLLRAISGISNIYSIRVDVWAKFDPNIFLALFSSALLSTYLYSKVMGNVSSWKITVLDGLVFVATEIILVLAIGGSV